VALPTTSERKRLFIAEMGIFAFCLTALTLAPNLPIVVLCLFGAGLALGCDYPTAHMIISESISTSARGRMVLTAFAFQAIGAFVGTLVGFVILFENPHLEAWRWMYAAVIIPAVLVALGRFFVTESPHWLVCQHRLPEAEQETILARRPAYPKSVQLKDPKEGRRTPTSRYGALFEKRNVRATMLASVPWFLQDMATYGIGIFTPTVLAAVIGAKSSGDSLGVSLHNDMLGARGSAIMDIFFVIGIIAAIFLVERVGRIKLQIIGFLGCAAGLLLSSLSFRSDASSNILLLSSGLMVFYFSNNLGPNAITYLLAREVFPTAVRGKGAGFAASFAKLGAVMAAFLFPIFLYTIGASMLLLLLAGTSLLGAVFTWNFAIETKGLNLEAIESGAESINSP
jgi:MFS transporter, putative metabolite transport protein